MRYFFHIGYEGTHYCGWQKHPGVASVQETIESALKKLLKVPHPVVGCGRTDSGVHAAQFFFHTDIVAPFYFDLKFRLNKALPSDIAVYDIVQVQEQAHARFDAYERTYNYFFHTFKSPFLAGRSALYEGSLLNLGKMQEAVTFLTIYNDYKAFCKSPAQYEHTRCSVTQASIEYLSSLKIFCFSITSNRFLKSMVRILANQLIAIGTEKLALSQFRQYFITPEQATSVRPAYPEGLYLTKIKYRFLNLPSAQDPLCISDFSDIRGPKIK